jgi:predicted aspartyl protease
MQVTVPLRFIQEIGSEGFIVTIPVMVNSYNLFQFVLDTGASRVSILPELAEQFMVASGKHIETLEAAGRKSVPTGHIASLAIGYAIQNDVEVWVGDLPPVLRQAVERGFAGKLGGKLGHNFLEKYRVTIDYQRGECSFAQREEPDAENIGEEGVRASLNIVNRESPWPLVSTWVNGRGPYEFLLDTGASVMTIVPSLAEELKLPLSTNKVPVNDPSDGVFPSASRLDTVSVENAVVHNLEVSVYGDFDTPSLQRAGAKVVGAIGNKYLRAFRTIIDYIEEVLILQKNF